MALDRLRSMSSGRRNPAQVVSIAFAVVLLVGTALLMLPPARSGPGGAPFMTALFTSGSAVCVVGLGLVDTATYWTTFGQAVIVGLVQVGGFGIIVGASLVGIVVSRRLGLRTRLTAQAETRALDLADVRRVVLGVAVITVVVEVVTAVVIGLRLALGYGEAAGTAAWHGVFLSVTSYNNAGFAPYSDNLMGFVGDPVVCIAVSLAVIIGGIGFPVLFELAREWRQPRTWSVHTRTTLIVTSVLLLGGWAFLTVAEWGNPGTFGPLSAPTKVLAGFFQSVQPRTAGFNTVDIAQLEPESILLTQVLMFIGGGSGSTAGGIRVTTLAVLVFAIRAEIRGTTDVNAFNRRIPASAVRQAAVVTVVTGAIALAGTGALLLASDLPFTEASFEIISALGTVGLSMNVTGGLTGLAPLVVTAVMFVGRLGPVTLGAAFALRETQSLYRLPEERTIVG